MSEIINLPDSVIKALAKPLPDDATSPHPTKSYLSTINAAHLMERLDDIFSPAGWHIEDSGIEWRQQPVKKKVAGNWQYVTILNPVTGLQEILIEDYACTKVTLTITEYNLVFTAYGGSNNDDPGDMMKGAVTDGFTSCCKQLGVGRHVWMGKKGALANNSQRPAPRQSAPPVAQKPDPVKIASEFLSNCIVNTINDLNDALAKVRKAEFDKETKGAAWIILKGHAKRLGAGYIEDKANFEKIITLPAG